MALTRIQPGHRGASSLLNAEYHARRIGMAVGDTSVQKPTPRLGKRFKGEQRNILVPYHVNGRIDTCLGTT